MNYGCLLMRSCVSLLFCLIGVAMCRAAGDESVDLPKSFGIWNRSGEVRRILPDRIFDYMDGAGELYIGYRFKYLEVAEYAAPDEDRILVELYRMASSDDAFGLLSGDWGGEPVELGQGDSGNRSPAWLPDRKALYGAGLLRIWSGDLYARVMAYRESARSKETVLKLGSLIVAGRKGPAAPALLASLPQEAAPGLNLRTDRFCYFRSHLVLNSIYFLSTKNILDLDKSAEAVTASYSPGAARENRKPVQLLLIRYANDDAAKRARAHFEKAYLPGRRSGGSGPSQQDIVARRVEDGWLGHARNGRMMALVFGCASRDEATCVVGGAITRLVALEAEHE